MFLFSGVVDGQERILFAQTEADNYDGIKKQNKINSLQKFANSEK